MYLKPIKIFIKANSQVLFMHADKGNTVAIDKTDYFEKIELMSDSNTYSIVKYNSANKLITELRENIKEMEAI